MSFSDVSGVSNHFVTPNEGFSTTTSGTVASGATSVGLNSVTGMTNGTVFVGVIEPAGTKEQIFTGVVDTSGSQITSVVWTKGSNIDHAAGVSVVDYDTGTALKMMTKGIKVQHNQDGTHGAITGTSANVTGALTGTSLVNALHTHANAAGGGQLTASALGTDSSWVWTSWTPTFANLTIGNGILTCKYTQVGKTVIARVGIALGGSSSMGSAPTFTLPVTANSGYSNGQWLGSLRFVSNAVGYLGYAQFSTTTTALITASTVSGSLGTGLQDLGITSTVPNTWGTTGTIFGTIVYEAA